MAARAEARLAKVGLGERVCCLGGDFRGDPVPRGADLISLVRVVHDHEDATVRVLLRAAREALEPGGTLLVAEPMAAVGAESATAYFLFYLLAMGSGRPRTPEALSALLHEAGFSRVRKVPTRRPLLVCLLAATP
ncbi:methyltransferase [Pararhodospirillum photometricum]|uniref:Hydroxyneurosporene methyltransferase n=1 Tax=Pararhodospirillum photometricum DSM 122 TaxID=1150469 RepID=H6SJG3_PARPM|nr:Hydroxyneurosporene methyltransferase [Pararhodospirillum photometricum DSM 122]